MMTREHPALSYDRTSSCDYSDDACLSDASRATTWTEVGGTLP